MSEAASAPPLPVTVLSGFLGAGKTTLLKHILQNRVGLRIALVVNDMASINVDAELVREGGVLQQQEKMVELSNGCICCTLREDLLTSLSALAAERRFDHVLVESSGISEPLPVAETFTFQDKDTGASLSDVATLNNLVTVVDAATFFEQLRTLDKLADRGWQATSGDKRSVAELLCDQVDFADVILINKIDLVDDAQLRQVETVVRKINPLADIQRTEHGRLDPAVLLGKARFQLRNAEEHPQWLAEARENEHTPETVEYGISSFVYRATRPFHPQRLHDALGCQQRPGALGRLLRLKGFAWLATRNQMQVNLALAGKQFSVSPGRPWHEAHGDRRTSLVCIGQELDHAAVGAALDACLLTTEEMAAGEEGWLALQDPLTGAQAAATAVAAAKAAMAHEKEGRLAEAAVEYERVLRIKEQVYAEQPNHPDLTSTVSSLASCRRKQGQLQAAAELYERAMRMEEITYAEEPDHAELATTVCNLAGVMEALGRLSEAAEGYERALLMFECYHFDSPNHLDLATTLHNLAGVHEAQGRIVEAADEYERALRIKEVAYAEQPDHPELGVTVYNLASVREAQGRLSEAAAGYERALRIEEQEQPDSAELAGTVNDLAGVYEAQGRWSEAAEAYERALRILKHPDLQAEQPEHPDIAMTLEKLAGVREQGRQSAEDASPVVPMVARKVDASRDISDGTPVTTAFGAKVLMASPPPRKKPHQAGRKRPAPAVYESDSLAGWLRPEAADYDGLLVKRPFDGAWDRYARDVDEARTRWANSALPGHGEGLLVQASGTSPRQFSLAVDKLLEAAALPSPLSTQIHRDACSLADTWRQMCPQLEHLHVQLEIFGEKTCSRWHQDNFVGRAIVTYTGPAGTDFTGRDNVNFEELHCCGKSEHCIYDLGQAQQAAVGDLLLMKGTKFPTLGGGVDALVHKSPEKRYDSAGGIIYRLVLKVDVHALKAERTAGEWPLLLARETTVVKC